MSKLYPTSPVESVSVGDRVITANEDGSFDFDEELADSLRRTHVGGAKTWEDEGERFVRMTGIEAARRADPASLYEEIVALRADQKANVVKSSAAELRAAAAALIADADAADKADAEAEKAAVAAEKADAAAAKKAETAAKAKA